MRNPFPSSNPNNSHPHSPPTFATPLPVQPSPPSYPEHVHSPSFDPYMASGSQDVPPSPTVPSSLPSTSGPLKPWLGLKARLGLSLISPTILALLFVGARLFISTNDVDDKVEAAKERLMASCRGVEAAASSISSLPHFFADGMNARTADAIDDTVAGMQRVLYLGVVAIEEILTFIVDSYRSLFLCFIELLVRGTLSILMSAVELFSEGVQAAGTGIKSVIQTSISGVNDFISTALGGVNDVLKLIGQSITIPTIAQPDLSALDNITLPSSFEQGLINLNNSLPTLDDLKNKVDDIIQIPFEKLKTDINSTLGTYSFDRSILPVPQVNTVQFCSTIDTSPLEDLGKDMQKICYIGVGILAAIAVLLMLLNFLREWWSWRSLKRHVEATREAWLSIDQPFASTQESRQVDSTNERRSIHREDPGQIPRMVSSEFLQLPNLFSLLQLSTHPLLAMLAFRLAKLLGIRSPQAKSQLRWWLAFISHPAAIAALAIGLFGFLSVQLQLLALKPIQDHYSERLDGSFNSIGDDFLSKINDQMQVASYDFSNKSNELILSAENELNDHLLSWVNTTTSTMNDTLNEFMDGLATTLNETFSNTPLFTPLQSFISCIIGQKVAGIETALTWIHENAEVHFPTVSPNVLMLDSARSQELVAPVKDAALGDGSQDNQGLVPRLVNSYAQNLQRERIMFLIFMAVYVLIFLIGTVIALWNGFGSKKWQERKLEKDSENDYSREKVWNLNNVGFGASDCSQGEHLKTPQAGLDQDPGQTWPNPSSSNSFLSLSSSQNDENSPVQERSLDFPSIISPQDDSLPLPPSRRFEAVPRSSTSTPDSHFFRSRPTTPAAQVQPSKISLLWGKTRDGLKDGVYWWFHGSQTPAQMREKPEMSQVRPQVDMSEGESGLALSRDVPIESNLETDVSTGNNLHSQLFHSDQNVRYPHHHRFNHSPPKWSPESQFPHLQSVPNNRESQSQVLSPSGQVSRHLFPPRPLPTPPASSQNRGDHSTYPSSTTHQGSEPEIKRPVPQFAMDKESILGSRTRRTSQQSSNSSNLSLSSQRKSIRNSPGFSPLRLKNRDPSLRFRTLSSVAEVRESISPQASPRVESVDNRGSETVLERNRDCMRDHILTGSAF